MFEVSITTIINVVDKKRITLTEEEKKEYNYAHVKSFRKRNKERAVEYKGGKCEHCLQTYQPAVFDFHHLDSSTKHKDPGLMMSCSDEKLFKELDKCILLCANCHRIEHANNEY